MAEDMHIREPVLPKPGKRNVLITSALPYVNNVPHLGNVIGSVLSADVFARYCRARGVNTLYVCGWYHVHSIASNRPEDENMIIGTDEYGTTTEARALLEKCTPQELCDKYHTLHANVYKWFNIDFDIFGRTTTKLQTDITQDIFLKLNHNKLLEERETTQLYCQHHHSFLSDRFVEGECPACGYVDARGDQCDLCGQLLDALELKNPRCKLDGATPSTRKTKHIFLKLDKLQPDIEAFTQQSTAEGGWSSNGKEITSAWLKEGLKPRSITRDMKWGTKVPLPEYDNKVIYPWFDACIGYVSITATYTAYWQKWWHNPQDVQLYQFIGKDNVLFHSVIFPGSQIGTRDVWTKLHHLSTTEYLTYEGGKFSKSRGIGVFGDSAQMTGVPSDIWRYYLLANRPETSDSEFTWETFIASNNNSLLKNVGNFVSRVIKFVNSKHFDGIVPDYIEYTEPSFDTWKADINSLLAQYIRELDAVKLRAGITTVLHVSNRGNIFLQANNLDNKLAETHPAKCAAVIGLALNLIHLLASILAPYMPDTAKSINAQLQADPLPIPSVWNGDSIKPGHKIGKAGHLFTMIKSEKAQEWREMYGSEEAKKLEMEEMVRKAAKLSLKQKNTMKKAGQEHAVAQQ